MRKLRNIVKEAVDEWLHLIDPERRKRKFHLVDNWVTTHKHARWIALGAYVLGVLLILAGYILTAGWSVLLMVAGLVIWIIPIMWVAHKWSRNA